MCRTRCPRQGRCTGWTRSWRDRLHYGQLQTLWTRAHRWRHSDLGPLRHGLRRQSGPGRTVPSLLEATSPSHWGDHGEGHQGTVVTWPLGFVCGRSCGLWGSHFPGHCFPLTFPNVWEAGSQAHNPGPPSLAVPRAGIKSLGFQILPHFLKHHLPTISSSRHHY